MDLINLRTQVEQCRKCPLHETRTNIVFGSGSEQAKILIVGEAPGKNEDLKGYPFVGAAGKYLDELLAIAGITREEVYIANVLKCRPPSNRNPKVEEIESCAPYLREQTRVIMPDIIVTLGNFATRFILKREEGITLLRGRVFKTGRFLVLPVFHPAAALYDVNKKEALENDFRLLARMIEQEPENRE